MLIYLKECGIFKLQKHNITVIWSVKLLFVGFPNNNSMAPNYSFRRVGAFFENEDSQSHHGSVVVKQYSVMTGLNGVFGRGGHDDAVTVVGPSETVPVIVGSTGVISVVSG